MFLVVCCLLIVVSGVACGLLNAFGSLLFAVWCASCGVCCLLLLVVWLFSMCCVCWLIVVCCLLVVVRCVLVGVDCVLIDMLCLLSVVCCSMCVVGWWLMRVLSCCLLFADDCLLCVAR